MGKLFSKLKQYLVVEEWNIAIREKGETLLFEQGGAKQPFYVLKNSFRYWAADPFIISDKDKDYLFFEMFDRFKRKGLIGYREITGGKFGRMKCVYKQERHLSFPFVFQSDGAYYMMPEASESKTIPLLRANHFPDGWEMIDTVLDQQRFVDSALLSHNGEEYLFTQVLNEGYRSNTLDIYKKTSGSWAPHNNNPVVTAAANARMAGKIIAHRDCLLRVAQDCSESYGKKLHFLRIDALSGTRYEETEVTEIGVDDVQIDHPKEFNGIHTYNFSERYEVIDLKNRDHVSMGNVFYIINCALRKLLRIR